MNSTASWSVRVALVVVALALASCIKYREVTTVFPDGSGKIEISIGGPMEEGAASGAPEDPPTIEELARGADGIVAWSEPVTEDRDGFRFFRLTAYFDDLNQVRLYRNEEGEERRAWKTFHWEAREGGGYRLVVEDAMWQEAGAQESQPVPEEQRDMMRQMMRGFEWTMRIVMPGTVGEVEGFQRDGDRALEAKLDVDSIIAGRRLPPRIEATCGASSVAEADLSAWRDELRQAKESWERRRSQPQEQNP